MKTLCTLLFMLPIAVYAAEADFTLIIKNHHFQPAELDVPADKKVKLLVFNQDSTPEEFESHSLNRERIIAGSGKAIIYIGPLSEGRYEFYGEFNEATAQGVIVAK